MLVHDDDISICAAWGGMLFQEGFCSSLDEAAVIVDVIWNEMNDEQEQQRNNNDIQSSDNDNSILESSSSHRPVRRHLSSFLLEQCLVDNLDLPNREEAQKLAAKLLRLSKNTDEADEKVPEVESKESVSSSDDDDDDDDDENDLLLFDGECELCDRYIQLTKHHLIPKSTWPRVEPRLMHAAEAIGRGDPDKAAFLLGPGMIHLLDDLQSSDKHTIRRILHRTCDICRPCHSAVHKAHDNMELAISYCTIDLILEDKQVAKFCKWANKQRVGRYAVK